MGTIDDCLTQLEQELAGVSLSYQARLSCFNSGGGHPESWLPAFLKKYHASVPKEQFPSPEVTDFVECLVARNYRAHGKGKDSFSRLMYEAGSRARSNYPVEHQDALKIVYALRREAANKLQLPTDAPRTRQELIRHIVWDTAASFDFGCRDVSKNSAKAWLPKTDEIDAIVELEVQSAFRWFISCGTERPRGPHDLFAFNEELEELGTSFDKLDITTWAVPKSKEAVTERVAFEINSPFYFKWPFFHSPQGLAWNIRMHLLSLKCMLMG